MSTEQLTIKAERRERVCVVALTGPLTVAAAAELTDCIRVERDARPGRLVIDMSGVSSVDFGGARTLATVAGPVPGQCPVIVRSLRPAARQQLALAGLDLSGPGSGPADRHTELTGRHTEPTGARLRGWERTLADSATAALVREWRYLLGSAEQAIADGHQTAQSLAVTEDHVAATFGWLATRRPAASARLEGLSQTARDYAIRLRTRRQNQPGLVLAADPAPARPAYNPTGTVGRAVAFIEERARDDISVTDIAAAAFVTVRAVQLAFRRYLDTTPLAYLRQVRLEGAHDQLVSADPSRTTVTAVAADWHFTNASRFSAYYRAAYGIPPAETLRQRASAN